MSNDEGPDRFNRLGGVVLPRPPSFYENRRIAPLLIAANLCVVLTCLLTGWNIVVDTFAPNLPQSAEWSKWIHANLELVGRTVLSPLASNLQATPDASLARWVAGLLPVLAAGAFWLMDVFERAYSRMFWKNQPVPDGQTASKPGARPSSESGRRNSYWRMFGMDQSPPPPPPPKPKT